MVLEFSARTEAEDVAAAFSEQITGKTVVITGPTWGGIGGEAARVIAKHSPTFLILAGRDSVSLENTANAIKQEVPDASIRTLILDLASLQSVRAAAREVLELTGPVDVLINNAGIMSVPYGLTVDGFERHFATNYLGHFMFTNLIMHKLRESPAPRVVNITSRQLFRSGIRFDDIGFSDGSKYDKLAAYAQSKTANALFSVELAYRFRAIRLTSFSVHPGVVPTNLTRNTQADDFDTINQQSPDLAIYKADGSPNLGHPVWRTLGAGAATQIRGAFDPSLADRSGSYLADCEIANDQVAPHALNKHDAARLWVMSEGMVGIEFPAAPPFS